MLKFKFTSALDRNYIDYYVSKVLGTKNFYSDNTKARDNFVLSAREFFSFTKHFNSDTKKAETILFSVRELFFFFFFHDDLSIASILEVSVELENAEACARAAQLRDVNRHFANVVHLLI